MDRDDALGEERQSDPDEVPMTNDTGVAGDEKNPLYILASAAALWRLESFSTQIFQENQEPPSQYEEIIGQGWTGPFEKELTGTEVEKYSITIKKSEFDKFIEPLLADNDQEDLKKDGIPVTIYSNEHVKKEFLMTLKVVKSDDSDGMYVLNGLKQKDSSKNITMSLIEVDAFVMIWMFRHVQDNNLCSVITLGKLAPLSSRIIFQEYQDPPSQYEDIIGECVGPFSKKLTYSDATTSQLMIPIKHSRDFIDPLFKNTDNGLKEWVPVTMFNDADGKGKKFKMNLTVRKSGQYALTEGWKEFSEAHENMIKADEYVTLWMFLHKKSQKLCFIITSGRVAEQEQNNLPEFPPVKSLVSLIVKCGEPFVKKLTMSDLDARDILRISKIVFGEYLEHLLYVEEKNLNKIPVTVYDEDGTGFSMILRKFQSEERALIQGWSEFRKKHNPIKDQEFVIWMFRNKRDQELGFVMISKESVIAAEDEPEQLQGE